MIQGLCKSVSNNNGSDSRRDRHDIVSEILKTAREGRIKTHIMYKAKLSYAQLNEYLPMLVENGFLENTDIKYKRKIKKVYKTTSKGLEFIHSYDAINVF